MPVTWDIDRELPGTWSDATTGGGDPATGTAPPANSTLTPVAPYIPPPPPPTTGCTGNPTTTGTLAGTVQRFEELPTAPAVGAIYEVAGNSDSGFTSYYVRWTGSVWDEHVRPGLKNQIDPTKMPHALVRKADGTFEFAPFCWKPRRVGDTVSNPVPAFIGRPIRDVFFYQNRLGFLVDESVVFSVAGDYGDFWRRTVLDYIDADTFSVSATTTDVALLDYAVPFNDGIMLFAGQRQFALSNGEAGTSAASIELNPVTSYSLTPGVRPVPLGDEVYFASEQGSYTAIQEYSRLDGRDATDAADITAHVPALLPPGVSKLIAAPDLDALLVLVANSPVPNRMYVYQFYWDGEKKILSAWRRWDFGNAQILTGAFADGKVTLVVRRGNDAFLETIDLQTTAKSDAQKHLLYLDRQVKLTGTYDSAPDTTTFTFPYSPDPTKLRLLRTETNASPESMIAGVSVSGATVTVPGNESATPVTGGEVYKTAMRFSRQFPVDFQNRALTSGRLQLRAFTVSVEATPFYSVEIQPYGPNANIDAESKTHIYQITGQRVGEAQMTLGDMSYSSGSTQFSVDADASVVTITLVNDTPFASNFVSAEWEGVYFNRAN